PHRRKKALVMIARVLSCLLFAVTLLLFTPDVVPAADNVPTSSTKVFPTTPITKPDGSRWRIGYVEGGNYNQYPLTLIQIVNGLKKLQWLTLDSNIPTGLSGHELWLWLAAHTQSRYVQ